MATSYRRKKEDEEDFGLTTPGGALHNSFDTSANAQLYASQKKDEDDNDSVDIFDAGAFGAWDDGKFNLDDLLAPFAALAGTQADALTNVGKGIFAFSEGIADAIGHAIIVPIAEASGSSWADDWHRGFTESSADKVFNPLEEYLDDKSVLGTTSQGVAQGAGQLLAQASASYVLGDVGGKLLMGAGSFGSGMSEAYASGATREEAMTYGALSAAIEVGSEMLFGGLGKGINAAGFNKGVLPLDDLSAKAISKFFKSQTGKNVSEFLVKSGFEGLEEVIAGYLSAHAKKGTFKSEEDFAKILEDEKLFEQFVVGALVSGIAQSGDVYTANKAGTDFVTGLTADEKTVVDKVYKDTLSEREKNGKLTNKEKTELYNDVLKQLDEGGISIDKITEILGGDDYKAYQDIIAQDKAAIEEAKGMYKGEELERAIADIVNNSKAENARNTLGSNVFERVKNSRLGNSYAEKENRGTKYTADLSKYNEKEQAIVQKAIDSGVLNNTRKAHRFVDLLAKIGADKGITFDFLNNAKLRESGFAVDGRQVNGFVNENGISINIESPKALQTTVGHEITHILEGTDFYDQLRSAVENYAKSRKAKGKYDSEYQERLAETLRAYKGVKGYEGSVGTEKVRREVVADLVGDYLFTDADFVNRLSTENRGVFKKIYDEIKYLCKIASGTKEARELERIKKIFEDAYRAETKNPTATGGVKYALESKTQPGRLDPKTVTRNDVLDMLQQVEKETIYGNTYIPIRINTPAVLIHWAMDRRGDVIDNNPIAISAEKAYNAMTRDGVTEGGRLNRLSPNDILSMVERMNDPQYIVYQGANDRYVEVVEFDTETGDKAFAVIEIGNDKNASHMNGYEGGLYNILVTTYPPKAGKLKELLTNSTNEIVYDKKKDAPQRTSGSTVPSVLNDTSFFGEIVPNIPENVNPQFSLSDSKGNALSQGQQEYFKDSKIRDDNGSLQVMYHGSPESFTVFDRKKARSSGYYGKGFYFTNSDSHAKQYGNTYEVYLNITNPLQDGTNDITKDQLRKFVEAVAEDEDYGLDNYGENATVDSVTNSVYGKSDFAMLMDINASCVGNLVEAIKLFNEVNGTDYNGIIAPTETVAFYPEQIKRVDNKTPTSDPDIRYSLSENSQSDNITPIGENVARATNDLMYTVEDAVNTMMGEPSGDLESKTDDAIIKTVKDRLNKKIENSSEELEQVKQLREQVRNSYAKKIADVQARLDAKANKNTKVAVNLRNRIANLNRIAADLDADLAKRISDIENRISKAQERMESSPKKDILEVRYERINKHLEADKAALAEEYGKKKEDLQALVADKNSYISNRANELYSELRSLKKGVRASDLLGYILDHGFDWGDIRSALINIKHTPGNRVNQNSAVEPIVREALDEEYEDRVYELDEIDIEYQNQVKELEAEAEKERERVRVESQRKTRAEIRATKIENVKSYLASKGFDLDHILDNPQRLLSTFKTVTTMPMRVLEKTFGDEEGKALSDVTVNAVAQNETAATRWLNGITDRKNGLLAKLSKEYNIKPGSDQSKAAQMYAEGFWVNENNELVAYGDKELAADFPDAQERKNIIGLAKDPRVRQFYDETLEMINESRERNGYPPIPKLENYYLHFIANEDFLSKIGIPFNPNDAKAKDLPTDLAGMTTDLKPGQPFFSSSMHRRGNRTSFDLLGGMERYANSAKNQIFHIDDIQTLRALQYYIADRFGQAHGLENLGDLEPDEMAERIQKVYDGHLSTFASFLNTEANILAGKTSIIDRSISEGALGRRVLTFLDAFNKHFGASAVGYNVGSALTNVLPVIEEVSRSNPADTVKAFAQTVSNVFKNGKYDDFRDSSSVYVRRKGTDRFNRTLWQKAVDPGFALMGAIDSFATEFIARTEYNKAIRKGKTDQQAHYEADVNTSRLMADRSLGQMPQIYTSRIGQFFFKFQLEVANSLDSMFYDTLQKSRLSHKEIEDGLTRNASIAADVAFKCTVTALAMHWFGTAFESAVGYNPAFDIVDAIIKAFGLDDEDEEDTVEENLRQGAMALLEDLPYSSLFLNGGRIPMSSMFPDVKEVVSGEDEYGNEVDIGDRLLEIVPYLLPAGGSQLKKTYQGLKMFDEDNPTAGSYTDKGDLRYPVEDTLANRLQALLFGPYANENARDYFDNERKPLDEKHTQEYLDLDIPIEEYWEYRDALSKLSTTEEKLGYISTLDLPTSKKNILANNIADTKDPIDMSEYGDMSHLKEFDYSQTNKNLHDILQEKGITKKEFESFDDDTKEAYKWAAKNLGKYAVSTAVSDDFMEFYQYKVDLGEIKATKDKNGNAISGSRKDKVIDYINDLDIDYGNKIILFKSEYNNDHRYDADIVQYLLSRDDISRNEMAAILTELGFRIDESGNIYSE